MRTLTITRQKSFVACLGKDQVYIEDPQAPELTIEGVPCRKLGDLKNGQTATFQIDEAQRRVYLIADKLSKEYCNASVTVPAGQENVSYSGKHQFVLGSNPFRFDGVELTEEQQRKQKKNGKKSVVIFIAAIIVGLVAGGIFGGLLALANMGDMAAAAEPKTFTKEDFSVTLTEAFTETELEGFFVAYESRDAVVWVSREELQSAATAEAYTQAVLEANGRTELEVYQGEGYSWCEYTETVNGQENYYLVACYCEGEVGWIVNFATKADSETEYKQGFLGWAESVTVND